MHAFPAAEEKPDIIGLQYAILRSNLDTKLHRMDEQVKKLVLRLVEGRFDRRYSIRLGLEGDKLRHVSYALHARGDLSIHLQYLGWDGQHIRMRSGFR